MSSTREKALALGIEDKAFAAAKAARAAGDIARARTILRQSLVDHGGLEPAEIKKRVKIIAADL